MNKADIAKRNMDKITYTNNDIIVNEIKNYVIGSLKATKAT